MVDVDARILHLECRRAALLATANTATTMASMYGRLAMGGRSGVRSTTRLPRAQREALVAKYCELQATRLADAAIAQAHARCLTIEICALRAISGESLQGT